MLKHGSKITWCQWDYIDITPTNWKLLINNSYEEFTRERPVRYNFIDEISIIIAKLYVYVP